MKVLVTGANGFLGYYLCGLLLNRGIRVLATGKGDCRLPYMEDSSFGWKTMDFTIPEQVEHVFREYVPEVVVHCGAISKPDDCEKDQWTAFQSNVEGTETLLEYAKEYRSFFIFLSTDFIFSGETGMYSENDSPGPVNFYGQTKLESEAAVKTYPFAWAIVRTVLVYGPVIAGRGNILTVVQDKLEKGEEYSVFDDQVRTPTYVADLANAIISIIEKNARGIFHISGEDILTPYEMACAAADYLGYDKKLIRKVTASEFVQPAKRPAKTGFDISKAKSQLGFQPLSFREGLEKTFASFKKQS